MLTVFAKSFKPLYFYLSVHVLSVRYVDVFDQQDVGQRVDNFLLRQLKGVPRQHIYRFTAQGGRFGLTAGGSKPAIG